MTRRPADRPDETMRLMALSEALHDAVVGRDVERVRTLLDAAGAMRLPHEVREEALAIVALPPTSYRVPMSLLRFHHRLTQLAEAEERDADPAQMEIPFTPDRRRRGSVHARRGSHGPPRDRV